MQWFATWGVSPRFAIMRWGIWQHPCSLKFALMWLSHHTYNHCLERPSDWHQQILIMGHDLTYVQKDFGTVARMPILMWGFFTPTLPATAPEVCLPRTRSVKMKTKECMASVYLKSNMVSSPHLYFQPQVVWEEKLRPSTNAWPTCWSLKHDVPYSSLMGWLRCKLSFAILRSAVMCIRRSRSSMHHAIRDSLDSPRLFWGLCATGILTIPHQEQNKSILFSKVCLL